MIHRLVTLFLSSFLALASLSASSAEEIYGLTAGGSLIRFDSESPGTITSIVQITGLAGGEVMQGIDFRTNTGQLYGVSNASHVYAIDVATGVATVRNETGFTPALSGDHFALDFNPTVDRLRCVGNTGQNLRLNPNDGLVTGTDTSLAFASLDPNFGNTPHVVALAYTNSFVSASSTTLFGIDSLRDLLVTVGSLNSTVSPNAGGVFTVGKLGVDTGDFAGLDISGQTGVAYAALTGPVASASKLYTINLSSGTATEIGSFPAGQILMDLAVVPAPTPYDFVVLRTGMPSTLARFRVETPSLASLAVTVTGLESGGETLLAIRYRPSTGQLYGLSSTNRIYTLDPVTGAAAALTPAGSPLPLNSSNATIAIDPVNDFLRIVTDTDQNLAVSAFTGLLGGAETSLAYVNGPNLGANPDIRAIAYAWPGGLPLFGIDASLDALVSLAAPPNGGLVAVGPLGVVAGLQPSLDITSDGTVFAVLANSLYTINPGTGAATLQPNPALGTTNVRSLAAVPAAAQTVKFSANAYGVIETNTVFITVTRTGIPSGAVTVDYTLTPNDATAATNVDALAGTLTFAAGETSRTISVPTMENHQLTRFQTATLTLSNPIGADLATPSTATLSIADLGDIDGDGFPNDAEVGSGSLPNDPASTPLNNAPAPGPDGLTVSKLSVKLNFAKQTLNDSLSFGGSFLNTVVPSVGKRFFVQLGDVNGRGGVILLFVFDSKGKAKGLTLSKPVKGLSKFTITLTKSNLIGALAGVGLVNQDLTAVTRPIPCTIYYDNKIFVCPKNVTYTAKTGKAGIATLKK